MPSLLALPASTDSLCFCRCHAQSVGDLQSRSHADAHGAYAPAPIRDLAGPPASGVDGAAYRREALAAIVACAQCRHLHCPALLCDVPELRGLQVRRAFAAARQRLEQPRIAPRKPAWDPAWGTPPDRPEVTRDDDSESSQG